MQPGTATAAPATAGNVVSATSNMKWILIGLGVLLLLGIGIAVYFYFQGKKKGQSQANINVSSPLNPDGTAPAASESEISNLVTQLHDDMEGINYTHDETIWNNFLSLSDSDIIKVNNKFNAVYQLDSGESFVDWVDDESGDYPQTALQRLKKLNLS